MASLGLPGLAGFWGEFPAILSAYEPSAVGRRRARRHARRSASTWWSPPIGTVLAAGYLLWMFQRVAFGKVRSPSSSDAHIHDVHVSGVDRVGADARSLIVALGFYPNLLFKITDLAGAPHARPRACRGRS